MHDHAAVIEKDPLGISVSFSMQHCFMEVGFHMFFHRLGDGGYLYIGLSMAYNKIPAHSILNLCHIQNNNIMSFFLLYAFYNFFS